MVEPGVDNKLAEQWPVACGPGGGQVESAGRQTIYHNGSLSILHHLKLLEGANDSLPAQQL